MTAGTKMRLVAAGAAILLLSGCAWVRLAPEGDSVRVLSASPDAGCERVGTVHARVAERVGFFYRNREKVSRELSILARNEAAQLGADTVVAESEAREGRQAFGAYRCLR